MDKSLTPGFFRLFICILLFNVQWALHAQSISSDEYYAMAKVEGNEKKNFAKAADYCEKALKQAPFDMDIKEYLGKCYMEMGQLEKARIVLLEVLQRSPKRVDARHYLLNIETQEKRYSSAVCYANELLEITPYSKTLWMRKINLYNLMNNRMEANRETRRLYQIFPDDAEIRIMYNNVLKEDALKMNKEGDLTSAVKQYEEALKVTKDDANLYLNLINLYLKLGNTNAALNMADRGLFYLPNNREILNKKIGILQEQGQYQQAIDLVQKQLKKGPSAYYSELLIYLTAEAARYYKNSDPYILYGQLYERDKGNTEAHDYLLSTALSRGYYYDAQQMLTQDLKSNPNSKELLSKQLYLYESQQNIQGANSTIEKLYALYPQDADIRAKYDALSYQNAKMRFMEQDYKAALPVFVRLSSHPEYGRSANNYIYSIYLAQKSYSKAMDLIDTLINENPGEHQLVLKKIDLLATMQDYENAYEMAREYRDRYPDYPEYGYMVKDLSIEYIKYLNEREGYATIKVIADELLETDPYNMQAYQYGIGARISMGENQEAMQLIQAALERFPDSKEMKLKEAGVYSALGEHEKAVASLKALSEKYPYNNTMRGALIEEMFLLAKQREDDDDFFHAKDVYHEILAIKPNDTLAALKLANIYIKRQEYVEAMVIVDRSLELNKDNNELLYKKGQIYEAMGDYKRALAFQKKYVPPYYKYDEHMDHLDYLEAKTFKNQVNISYLSATTDSIPINTSVATVEYLRFEKNNTYVGRMNYAARNTGVGVQGEVDWYHTFKNKSSFLANAGIANQFFSKYKVGLSYFQPYKKVWQSELGIRYTALQDDRNLISGILGLERAFDRVWLNARVSLMRDEEDVYNNILLQARFYMRNERNYVIAMASAGTAPEDQKLDFQTNTFLSYVNTMVGGGYFHYTSHRTSVGIMGNWYNYRVTENSYINQYNLFLTIRTRF
ncbi:tetratricopeptide repeat protein [Flavobacterium sp. MK4S-17]|uniref:tetratricopeptide repeat protein n=1 Tax=Flavobacterium sp. MK4S-17 TaxID=2543737 RepID=UPI00135C73ED|nr:tetratricopeptide repeat protein [Flavobacterium sp. MK4S-17]